MLPTINGKSFLEVTEDALKVLVENADYRESDYIDYKRNFAFLEIAKEKKQGLSSKLCRVCQVNCVSFFLKIFERGDFYSLHLHIEKMIVIENNSSF